MHSTACVLPASCRSTVCIAQHACVTCDSEEAQHRVRSAISRQSQHAERQRQVSLQLHSLLQNNCLTFRLIGQCATHGILSVWLVQHSTAQHSTAQHSTAQHSTAQHSTAQHSMAKLSLLLICDLLSISPFARFCA
jgi:hypothetical protein